MAEKRTILVVEDDEDQRFVISRQVQAAGYAVRQAVDGVEAIREVHRERPDLVLMDVRMPQMGGLEAALRIRSEHPDLPILMISVIDDTMDRYIASLFGAASFIGKPADKESLLAHIRRTLDNAPPASADPSSQTGRRTSSDGTSRGEAP